MNLYSIVAFVLAGGVFFVGVFTSTDNTSAFIDGHAALIVFGGTLAVAAISFQIDRMWMMLKVFYHRVVRGKKINYVPIIKDLMVLAEAYRKNDPNIEQIISSIEDHFIRECMGILKEGILDQQTLEKVLHTRVSTIFNRYNEDAKKFKAIGKFPPAMGLMGAVLGMIALLQTLGQPGAEENVGPAMAVAMVATLYGISFANLVVLPIAESLMEGAREVYTKNTIIAEAIKLIAQKKNRIILAEELNSYLLPVERVDWKDLQDKSKAA